MPALLVHKSELLRKLEEVGQLPAMCRRIIIDFKLDDTVKIYYECHGDARALDAIEPEDLLGAEAIRAIDMPDEDEDEDGLA